MQFVALKNWNNRTVLPIIRPVHDLRFWSYRHEKVFNWTCLPLSAFHLGAYWTILWKTISSLVLSLKLFTQIKEYAYEEQHTVGWFLYILKFSEFSTSCVISGNRRLVKLYLCFAMLPYYWQKILFDMVSSSNFCSNAVTLQNISLISPAFCSH